MHIQPRTAMRVFCLSDSVNAMPLTLRSLELLIAADLKD
jgi:hypothetical protein